MTPAEGNVRPAPPGVKRLFANALPFGRRGVTARPPMVHVTSAQFEAFVADAKKAVLETLREHYAGSAG